jgi:uncharacterized protein with ParB-like and HNH nuclease domain
MSDNKLQSLTEVFNFRFFRIPDFQRGYAWEERQLDDFWDDLVNLKSDRIHYTGLLTVEPILKSEVEGNEKWQDDMWLFDKGMTCYYVIDGQQRLTTAVIFISQILNKFGTEDGINFDTKEVWVSKFLYKAFGQNYKSFIFGYEKDNPSDEFFKTRILGQTSLASDKVPEKTLYTGNLNFAKDYFNSRLDKFAKPDLEDLFKKLVTRFKFNFYEIDDELDVCVTFETMNNRGKHLTNLELLKNRLIYLTTLLEEETSLKARVRKDINETWKTIYEYLGKNSENPLNDDEFLYNHWIVYFKYDRSEADSYAIFLLNEKFTASNAINGKLTLPEIKNYIDSLSTCIKSWFYLYNPEYSAYSDITKEWLQKLNRLGMSAFPPLLMACMSHNPTEDKLIKLLKAAEQFIFLVFRLSQRQSNTKNSHFYRLANMFNFGLKYWGGDPTDIDKVISDIQWQAQGESGEGDNYEYHGLFDFAKFRAYIKELTQKEDGYYSWNGLRYFLFEYELFLQDEAKGNHKVSWVDFNKRKKEDTIEHVYPQTPKDAIWLNAFKAYDEKQKKAFLHSLGNLLLLSRSKNSELQNNSFSLKCKRENSKGNLVGYYNGSYSEIQVSTYKDWTAESIFDRGKKMLAFMRDRWEFAYKVHDREMSESDVLQLSFISNVQEKADE